MKNVYVLRNFTIKFVLFSDFGILSSQVKDKIGLNQSTISA